MQLQLQSYTGSTEGGFGGGFVDYVISNNLNEFDFGCNLNSIYSPVQDEEITKLKILVRQTNSFITFIEVEGD